MQMADGQAPETIAINKCLDSLRRGLHPDDLVYKLFAAGILSDSDKSEANNYMLTKQRRTQIIVDAVASKVRDSPRIFHDFVQILKSEPAYDPIARQVQGELMQRPVSKRC